MDEKKNKPNDVKDDKLDIKKNVFQIAKENQKKKQEEIEKQQLEIQKKAEENEKRRREEYDRKNLEERRELIRLKQGIIEDSELVHEEQKEEVKMSFRGKIKNFFYLNKWWLGLGTFALVVICFLTYDVLSRPRPDMVVLVIGDYNAVGQESSLQTYLEGFAEDYNNNGKTEVSIYYIPYKLDDDYANYSSGSDTKLITEMQVADAVMVIAGDTFKGLIEPENILVDMSELYPEDTNVNSQFYYLKNTDFYQRIGVRRSDVPDDMYVCLRKPQKLQYSNSDEMQETYDKDFPVFEKFIEDIQKK